MSVPTYTCHHTLKQKRSFEHYPRRCMYQHLGCDVWTCEAMTFKYEGHHWRICRSCLNTQIHNDRLPK